ncbi:MAG: TlpA family protein disulfide reductase [Hymenobacter sp.]|nr:TlpA family protein disulfide reductase [Hymenobacter sp.]
MAKHQGKPFPAFEVTDYAGHVFNSQQLKGKVLVVNFWFAGCQTCELEIPELNTLYARYAHDSDVVFLSLVRSRWEVVDPFLVTQPFNYPIVTLDKALLTQLQSAAYPTNLVIDKTGRYAYESVGAGVGSILLLETALTQALR